MSGKQKRKPIVESSGGLEDWLMPDFTRAMVEIGTAPVVGWLSLLFFHNMLISGMITVFIASPAIVTPVVRHVLKKVEAQIAVRDVALGQWADRTEDSIQDFYARQREQLGNFRDKVTDFETRMLSIASRMADKDPTIKLEIIAAANDIKALSQVLEDQPKPTIPSPGEVSKEKDDTSLGL